MKVTVNCKALVDALKRVKKAIWKKSSLPALQCVLMESDNGKINITATDIEIAITTEIEANVIESGKCLVPESALTYLAAVTTDQEIEISTGSEDTVLLKNSSDSIKLNSLATDNFPEIPAINDGLSFSIKQSALKDIVKRSTFAVATEDIRPVLQGVRMIVDNRKLTTVACDGFRLVVASSEVESSENVDFIISGKVLDKISSTMKASDESVQIAIKGQKAYMEYGNTHAIAKLFEGNSIVNYNDIIPKQYNTTIFVEADLLLLACEKAKHFITNRGREIVLDISKSSLDVSAESELGHFRSSTSIEKSGKDLEIAFNEKYLIPGLKQFRGKKIKIEFVSGAAPCLISEEDSDYRYLLLPMRIDSRRRR